MKTTSPVTWTTVKSWKSGESKVKEDLLAIEEPLQIRLQYGQGKNWQEKSLTITMRTPGNDFELATGLLLAENIIDKKEDIDLIRYCKNVKPEEQGNVLIVKLAPDLKFDFNKLERYFLSNSSCGICGKSAIEALDCSELPLDFSEARVSISVLCHLNERLMQEQTVFKYTGGIHAAALFDTDGNLLISREDVGRHNAFDKVTGAAMLQNLLPAKNRLIMLSGRVSFELVQKAVRAKIPLIAAVGAPSSLAVSLAKKKGITLIGFLKKESFNIYCGQERVVDMEKITTSPNF